MKAIFETCVPRDEVLKGELRDGPICGAAERTVPWVS